MHWKRATDTKTAFYLFKKWSAMFMSEKSGFRQTIGNSRPVLIFLFFKSLYILRIQCLKTKNKKQTHIGKQTGKK